MYISYLPFTLFHVISVLSYTDYDSPQVFDVDNSNLDTVDTITDTQANLSPNKSTSSVLYDKHIGKHHENNTTTRNHNLMTTLKPTNNEITSNNSKNNSRKINKTRFKCPEEEGPFSIGPYEIPSQRDLVLFTKDLLLNMFSTYEREAMSLLRDIKEAARATLSTENKCQFNMMSFRKCVKDVSGKSEMITKSLVASLELERHDIKALTENTICNLSDMKKDPMILIKTISQQQAMLKFALPGFLRLLKMCSALCIRSHATSYAKKPLRRMTDQDLVVKHFLTNKNYIQLIKDSRHNV